MRANFEDDEEEEGALTSLALPETWDVLGLGQAMVVNSIFIPPPPFMPIIFI